MVELALGSLNRARYAGLDFDTHNDDLLAQLQVKYASDFNDFSVSSLGIMLLDLTAYGLDTMSFYLDRRATDTYLATARTRASVSRTSRQLGYKMGGAVASSVDLHVTVREVFAFDVTVPARFQFDGPDGLIFECAEDVVFTPAEQGIANHKVIPAYEGETIQESFVSDGTSAQVFELRRIPEDEFVVQGTVEVTVDGAVWDESDLLEYGATDQFEAGYNDDPSTIRFGDGIAGNIPTAGASINVTYVASRGKSGLVSSGTIDEETTPLVVAFTEIPLTITNPEGSSGGDDRETLASAKAFAPKVWKSAGKAITGEDYDGLAGSYADPLFGRVAVAKAISSRSAGGDLTVQNYMTNILNQVDALNSSLTISTGNIGDALDIARTALTDLSSAIGDIASELASIESEATTARASARAIKNSTGEISTDASDIKGHVSSGIALVNASSADPTEKSNINAQFNLIDAEADAITSAAASVEASANAIVSDANSIRTSTEETGTDLVTSGTYLNDATQQGVTLVAQVAIIQTESDAIDTANADLVTVVETSRDGINAHLDRVLASDCKANLVTVAILARDAGGFYTAPSTGLIDSLQTDLDARKEVTQSVAVTSGENSLVRPVITVRVGIFKNYSTAAIKTAVEAAVQGVLRGRAVGVSLYESDLDDVILAIDGVAFVNARISGHLDTDGTTTLTSKLDASGNLIIEESEVITLGTITVNPEVYTT